MVKPSSPANNQPSSEEFEELEPLGVENPLLPRIPLGQRMLQPKFLFPLGAKPLVNRDYSELLLQRKWDASRFANNPFIYGSTETEWFNFQVGESVGSVPEPEIQRRLDWEAETSSPNFEVQETGTSKFSERTQESLSTPTQSENLKTDFSTTKSKILSETSPSTASVFRESSDESQTVRRSVNPSVFSATKIDEISAESLSPRTDKQSPSETSFSSSASEQIEELEVAKFSSDPDTIQANDISSESEEQIEAFAESETIQPNAEKSDPAAELLSPRTDRQPPNETNISSSASEQIVARRIESSPSESRKIQEETRTNDTSLTSEEKLETFAEPKSVQRRIDSSVSPLESQSDRSPSELQDLQPKRVEEIQPSTTEEVPDREFARRPSATDISEVRTGSETVQLSSESSASQSEETSDRASTVSSTPESRELSTELEDIQRSPEPSVAASEGISDRSIDLTVGVPPSPLQKNSTQPQSSTEDRPSISEPIVDVEIAQPSSESGEIQAKTESNTPSFSLEEKAESETVQRRVEPSLSSSEGASDRQFSSAQLSSQAGSEIPTTDPIAEEEISENIVGRASEVETIQPSSQPSTGAENPTSQTPETSTDRTVIQPQLETSIGDRSPDRTGRDSSSQPTPEELRTSSTERETVQPSPESLTASETELSAEPLTEEEKADDLETETLQPWQDRTQKFGNVEESSPISSSPTPSIQPTLEAQEASESAADRDRIQPRSERSISPTTGEESRTPQTFETSTNLDSVQPLLDPSETPASDRSIDLTGRDAASPSESQPIQRRSETASAPKGKASTRGSDSTRRFARDSKASEVVQPSSDAPVSPAGEETVQPPVASPAAEPVRPEPKRGAFRSLVNFTKKLFRKRDEREPRTVRSAERSPTASGVSPPIPEGTALGGTIQPQLETPTAEMEEQLQGEQSSVETSPPSLLGEETAALQPTEESSSPNVQASPEQFPGEESAGIETLQPQLDTPTVGREEPLQEEQSSLETSPPSLLEEELAALQPSEESSSPNVQASPEQFSGEESAETETLQPQLDTPTVGREEPLQEERSSLGISPPSLLAEETAALQPSEESSSPQVQASPERFSGEESAETETLQPQLKIPTAETEERSSVGTSPPSLLEEELAALQPSEESSSPNVQASPEQFSGEESAETETLQPQLESLETELHEEREFASQSPSSASEVRRQPDVEPLSRQEGETRSDLTADPPEVQPTSQGTASASSEPQVRRSPSNFQGEEGREIDRVSRSQSCAQPPSDSAVRPARDAESEGEQSDRVAFSNPSDPAAEMRSPTPLVQPSLSPDAQPSEVSASPTDTIAGGDIQSSAASPEGIQRTSDAERTDPADPATERRSPEVSTSPTNATAESDGEIAAVSPVRDSTAIQPQTDSTPQSFGSETAREVGSSPPFLDEIAAPISEAETVQRQTEKEFQQSTERATERAETDAIALEGETTQPLPELESGTLQRQVGEDFPAIAPHLTPLQSQTEVELECSETPSPSETETIPEVEETLPSETIRPQAEITPATAPESPTISSQADRGLIPAEETERVQRQAETTLETADTREVASPTPIEPPTTTATGDSIPAAAEEIASIDATSSQKDFTSEIPQGDLVQKQAELPSEPATAEANVEPTLETISPTPDADTKVLRPPAEILSEMADTEAISSPPPTQQSTVQRRIEPPSETSVEQRTVETEAIAPPTSTQPEIIQRHIDEGSETQETSPETPLIQPKPEAIASPTSEQPEAIQRQVESDLPSATDESTTTGLASSEVEMRQGQSAEAEMTQPQADPAEISSTETLTSQTSPETLQRQGESLSETAIAQNREEMLPPQVASPSSELEAETLQRQSSEANVVPETEAIAPPPSARSETIQRQIDEVSETQETSPETPLIQPEAIAPPTSAQRSTLQRRVEPTSETSVEQRTGETVQPPVERPEISDAEAIASPTSARSETIQHQLSTPSSTPVEQSSAETIQPQAEAFSTSPASETISVPTRDTNASEEETSQLPTEVAEVSSTDETLTSPTSTQPETVQRQLSSPAETPVERRETVQPTAEATVASPTSEAKVVSEREITAAEAETLQPQVDLAEIPEPDAIASPQTRSETLQPQVQPTSETPTTETQAIAPTRQSEPFENLPEIANQPETLQRQQETEPISETQRSEFQLQDSTDPPTVRPQSEPQAIASESPPPDATVELVSSELEAETVQRQSETSTVSQKPHEIQSLDSSTSSGLPPQADRTSSIPEGEAIASPPQTQPESIQRQVEPPSETPVEQRETIKPTAEATFASPTSETPVAQGTTETVQPSIDETEIADTEAIASPTSAQPESIQRQVQPTSETAIAHPLDAEATQPLADTPEIPKPGERKESTPISSETRLSPGTDETTELASSEFEVETLQRQSSEDISVPEREITSAEISETEAIASSSPTKPNEIQRQPSTTSETRETPPETSRIQPQVDPISAGEETEAIASSSQIQLQRQVEPTSETPVAHREAETVQPPVERTQISDTEAIASPTFAQPETIQRQIRTTSETQETSAETPRIQPQADKTSAREVSRPQQESETIQQQETGIRQRPETSSEIAPPDVRTIHRSVETTPVNRTSENVPSDFEAGNPVSEPNLETVSKDFNENQEEAIATDLIQRQPESETQTANNEITSAEPAIAQPQNAPSSGTAAEQPLADSSTGQDFLPTSTPLDAGTEIVQKKAQNSPKISLQDAIASSQSPEIETSTSQSSLPIDAATDRLAAKTNQPPSTQPNLSDTQQPPIAPKTIQRQEVEDNSERDLRAQRSDRSPLSQPETPDFASHSVSPTELPASDRVQPQQEAIPQTSSDEAIAPSPPEIQAQPSANSPEEPTVAQLLSTAQPIPTLPTVLENLARTAPLGSSNSLLQDSAAESSVQRQTANKHGSAEESEKLQRRPSSPIEEVSNMGSNLTELIVQSSKSDRGLEPKSTASSLSLNRINPTPKTASTDSQTTIQCQPNSNQSEEIIFTPEGFQTLPSSSTPNTIQREEESDGSADLAVREIPTSWSNLAELVGSSSEPEREQTVQRQVTREESNGKSQSVDRRSQNPTSQTIQRVMDKVKERASKRNVTPQENLTISRDYEANNSVTLSASTPAAENEDLENLDILAREIYNSIRQRLAIEQERRGRNYSGRLPW